MLEFDSHRELGIFLSFLVLEISVKFYGIPLGDFFDRMKLKAVFPLSLRTFTFDLVSVEKISFITSTLVTTICIYTAVLTAAIVGLAFIDVCKRETRQSDSFLVHQTCRNVCLYDYVKPWT